MAQDALDFYNRDIQTHIEGRFGEHKELLEKNEEVVKAWQRFKGHLLRVPTGKSFAIGGDGLKRIIATSFGYPRSLEEILEIAQAAHQNTQERICEGARQIDCNKPWKRIIYEQVPLTSSPARVQQFYQQEVTRLRRFFYSQDIMTFPPGEKVTVLQTPVYLRSLRATASYRAPLTGNAEASGIFYITPGKEDLKLISAHCPYLTAHETYPGHHILDHLRLHHTNPIRRQIESPLFYEGWATYAEQLLDEFGYIEDPRQQLVQLKRQLWRNLRAVLDIELHTGKIGLAQATEKINALGFSSKRARRQVRRFALTPGYQLCYFMGAHEIIQLRDQFSPQLGLKAFHDILLGGGEIPFHRVEKRFKACLHKSV
jgi:uncharacterized protein (DUF885 family)